MEYQSLIEKHECLKRYFTEFPKQLHRLASEGKSFLRFEKKGLWINCMELSDYLQSSESIFRVRHIMDFIETLHVLQFSRVNYARGETCYFFANSNFTEDQTVPNDFYKQPADVKALSGARRLTTIHHFSLFERLLRSERRSESRISKLQLAQLRLKFALQRKLDEKRHEQDIVSHIIEEPDYVKNQEIAGYYGNVELSLLKNAFGDYYPVYKIEEPVPMEAAEPTSSAVPASSTMTNDQQQQVPMDIDDSNEPIIDVGVEVIPETPQTVPVLELSLPKKLKRRANDENKENEPPRKQTRRSYNQRITAKETNDALLNLEKEFGNFDSAC